MSIGSFFSGLGGPLIGAAASVAGDLFSQSGQQSSNAANLAMQKQMEDWMKMMSDTSMQRRVSDLKAAGLNPLLAVTQGGASTPGVPPVNIQNPSAAMGNLGGQVTGAIQLAQQSAQIDALRAQANKAQADADMTRPQIPYSGERAMYELDNIKKENDAIFWKAQNLSADFNIKNDAQLPMLMQDKRFQEQFLELRNGIMELDQRRQNLGMPRLENDAAWQRTHPVLSGWLQSGATDAATSVINTALKSFTPGNLFGMESTPGMGGAVQNWRRNNLRSGDVTY